jgi:ATP-binding cassette, subfamily C (CFTR/MRP), member 1
MFVFREKMVSSIVYPTMTYFQVLQGSLIMFPSLISVIINYFVSLKRVTNFLNAEEIKKIKISEDLNNEKKYSILINECTFKWDPIKNKSNKKNKLSKKKTNKNEKTVNEVEMNETITEEERIIKLKLQIEEEKKKKEEEKSNYEKEFKLINLDMKIEKSKLIFVIGEVGSGKSSLLQALIGEMRIEKGDFSINGSTCKKKKFKF